jgi:hypothetical protein
MGFGLWKKIKQGSKKVVGGIGKAMDIVSQVSDVVPIAGAVVGGLTDLIASTRPPKPDWGGPSETQDNFTRLMEKRQILPPWVMQKYKH